MDEQSFSAKFSSPEWMRASITMALGLLALFLLAATIYVFQSYRFIGSGVPATNTVTVSGEGEVFAVPDIASFSVMVQERGETVGPAQDAATEKSNAVIAYLKEQGIEEKDIKTTEYSVYPRYEYLNSTCRDGYCPPGEQTLVGYEVSQTLLVKVRETKKAGEILSGVGKLGASSVSGLSFTIDDEDALKMEARGMAIRDAEARAEALSKQLGVRLVRIVGFNEDGSSYPPIAYGMGGEIAVRQDSAKATLELPVGENKITSNVSITYEIR